MGLSRILSGNSKYRLDSRRYAKKIAKKDGFSSRGLMKKNGIKLEKKLYSQNESTNFYWKSLFGNHPSIILLSTTTNRYPDQQTSREVTLQQGEYYFLESFMKEGSGGDDLSVGVRLPDGNFELPISSNLFLVPGKCYFCLIFTSSDLILLACYIQRSLIFR